MPHCSITNVISLYFSIKCSFTYMEQHLRFFFFGRQGTTKVKKQSASIEKQTTRPDQYVSLPWHQQYDSFWRTTRFLSILGSGEVYCFFFFFFLIHSSPSVEGCRCEAAVFNVTSHTFAQRGRLGSHLSFFAFLPFFFSFQFEFIGFHSSAL